MAIHTIVLQRNTCICRVPELAGLLDPATQLPAAPWTGANLALLSPLGLRSSVTGETVLQAARYIEALAATDVDTAYSRCVSFGWTQAACIFTPLYNLQYNMPYLCTAFASPSLEPLGCQRQLGMVCCGKCVFFNRCATALAHRPG